MSAHPLVRDAFQLAVFSGTQIRSGVSWLGGSWLRLPDTGAGRPSIPVSRLEPTSLSHRRSSLQALTLSEGVGFITWRPGHVFQGISTELKGFLNRRACGFRPWDQNHFKKALGYIRPVGEMYDKYPNDKYLNAVGFTHGGEEVSVSAPTSKLLKVGSASLPRNEAADEESNQWQSRTQHSPCQLPSQPLLLSHSNSSSKS